MGETHFRKVGDDITGGKKKADVTGGEHVFSLGFGAALVSGDWGPSS